MPSPLIDAVTLAERIGDPDWVVVDCRFNLMDADAGRIAYQQGHIPGARYAHLDDDLAGPVESSGGRHPLPAPDLFAKTLGNWGISNSSSVVVYDDVSGALAARLWWMLRWLGHDAVFVLNGGIQAWEAAQQPLETMEPAWEPAVFSVGKVRDAWVVDCSEIANEIGQGAALVDARSRERFVGAAEPIDKVAGHVPGALNYPFSAALSPEGFMRSTEQLQHDLKGFVERPGGLIAMCGSGVTACHLLLAANAAGLGDGRVYIGSWSDWISHPERLIATDAEAPTPAS